MRELFKGIARGGGRVVIFFLSPLFLLERLLVGSVRAFQSQTQLLSQVPGVIGEYLRREYLRLYAKSCGRETVVSFGTIFSTPEVELGERSYIGNYCVIGNVRIEESALIASRVSLLSGVRQHGIERGELPIRDQPGQFTQITIGRGSWIGEGAIVGADVGPGAVVAAGSVVLKVVLPQEIVGGNPAEHLRNRGE